MFWPGIVGNECPLLPPVTSLLIIPGMIFGIISRSLGTHLIVGAVPWRVSGVSAGCADGGGCACKGGGGII